jgi:hypothetical protein
MIEFNLKEKQFFLSSNISKKLIEKGIAMDDSHFVIVKKPCGKEYITTRNDEAIDVNDTVVPTYTLPELLYKIPEYAQGKGMFSLWKDAPFYPCQFGKDDTTLCISESPLYSAANFLMFCKTQGYYIPEDISDKEFRMKGL